MANTIQIKRSSTAAAIPTAGQLAAGELAVNLVDRKLYSKNASGTVIQLGGGATGPGVAAGGTTGQFLKKNSSTDYDTSWTDTIDGGTY